MTICKAKIETEVESGHMDIFNPSENQGKGFAESRGEYTCYTPGDPAGRV